MGFEPVTNRFGATLLPPDHIPKMRLEKVCQLLQPQGMKLDPTKYIFPESPCSPAVPFFRAQNRFRGIQKSFSIANFRLSIFEAVSQGKTFF